MKIKRILALLLTLMLLALPLTTVLAYTEEYPASSVSKGLKAPKGTELMIGELIGAEGGWNDNPDVGRTAAFDGDPLSFYDPAAANDPEHYVGVKMPAAYILTEIRILPRTGFLDRFEGAAIWGFNGDTFDPATATLIWVSDEGSEGTEDDEGNTIAVFQVIPATKFIPGKNTGFTSFAYFNEAKHGDVAEIELYGNPGSVTSKPYVDGGIKIAAAGTSTIEAVHFNSGVFLELSPTEKQWNVRDDMADVGGTQTEVGGSGYEGNIGWTAAGEWVQYTINVEKDGKYNFAAYLASGASTAGNIEVLYNDKSIGKTASEDVGDWQAYDWYPVGDVDMTAGAQTITVIFFNGNTNFAALEVKSLDAPAETEAPVVDNPPVAGEETTVSENVDNNGEGTTSAPTAEEKGEAGESAIDTPILIIIIAAAVVVVAVVVIIIIASKKKK